MNMIVTTPEAQKGFYPTPPELAAKLVEGIDINKIATILEPSAGTGNLLYALAPAIRRAYYSRYGNTSVDIDCCEIDPAIRGILSENFSDKAVAACKTSQKAILEAEGLKGDYDSHKLSPDAKEHEYVLICRKDEPIIIPVLLSKTFQTDIRDMRGSTWRDVVYNIMEKAKSPLSLNELYEQVDGHEKAKNNAHWREKIRQTLQMNPRYFRHTARGMWEVAA